MTDTGKFDSIDRTFNIGGEMEVVSEVEVKPADIVPQKDPKSLNDIDDDYKYTRSHLYSLIEKGQEAINGILELAHESEMPRAYEVAGQLIKNVGDITDKLMDLQKKLKDVESDSPSKGPTNVTNALFVGSTADLAKLIKNNLNTDK
jgi:hypothetical protein